MFQNLRLALFAIPLLFVGTACTSLKPEPASDYYAYIRVTSTVMGGGVKVNGIYATSLPGRIEVDVDEQGAILTPHTIQLSTNIIGDVNYYLAPGTYAPARIDFVGSGANASGLALINYRGPKDSGDAPTDDSTKY